MLFPWPANSVLTVVHTNGMAARFLFGHLPTHLCSWPNFPTYKYGSCTRWSLRFLQDLTFFLGLEEWNHPLSYAQCVLKDEALPWLPRWSGVMLVFWWSQKPLALTSEFLGQRKSREWRHSLCHLHLQEPSKGLEKKCALSAANWAIVPSSQERRMWSSGDWRHKLLSY